MLFYTHILLGIGFFLLFRKFLPGDQIVTFLLVIFGAILPDIDEAKSKISQWSGIIGKSVNFFAKHRGIFHSLIFSLGLFLVIYFLWNFVYAWAILVGYISHLIGDALTPMGVQVFYPFSKFKLRGPVKTGGMGEWIVLAGLVVFIVKVLLF